MILDPRTKMVMIICLSSLALIYNTPGKLLAVLAAAVILLAIFRFNPGVIWGYLKPFLSLMLFLFIIQSVFSPGDTVLWTIGSVPLVTAEGLILGANVVLRIVIITVAAMILTTFNSRDFILGLVQWKIPYELAFMTSVALRFLPVFKDELTNTINAVQLRGVELKRIPWGQKIGMYKCLFFPVVYRTILKAQQLAVAMEARGFRAYPRRTYLRQLNLNWNDYIIMMLFLSATGILVIWHIT